MTTCHTPEHLDYLLIEALLNYYSQEKGTKNQFDTVMNFYCRCNKHNKLPIFLGTVDTIDENLTDQKLSEVISLYMNNIFSKDNTQFKKDTHKIIIQCDKKRDENGIQKYGILIWAVEKSML